MIPDSGTGQYKILIVDDIETNIILLRAQLKNSNYVLVSANSGGEALVAVEKENPDLLIVDVMMPDMTGFEVAQILRSRPETVHLPIIFLTALNATSDIVKGFQCGGNDYIAKPFNKEELRERVKLQLSLVEARRTITEKNEELIRTIKGRDRLYSVIAHDLRSPMASLKMSLNMLQQYAPEEIKSTFMFESLCSANETAEHLFSLLDNLLKWTKSQSGRLNIVYQDFKISEVAVGLIDVFKLFAEQKNVGMNLVIEQDSEVRGDIDMFKTVLRNLLSNALKFSKSGGGDVVITVRRKADFAEVSVKDTGCGIKPEDKRKIFDSEEHFTTYGTSNEEGSGLGLMLCHDFVIKNGGKIWFESTVDVGTEFIFTIPLSVSSATTDRGV